MFRFSRQFPFGNVRLDIDIQAQVSTVRDAEVSPKLPDGMHVENCTLLDFAFHCEPLQDVTLTFTMEPLDDWFGGFSSGEWLDAFAFEGPNMEHAAVGMRDPEWLCHAFSLELLDASHPKPSDLSCVASYRTRSAGLITVQLACARSKPTRFNGSDSSPWFAVDLAMTS